MSMSVAPPAQVGKVGSTTSGSEVPSRSSSKAGSERSKWAAPAFGGAAHRTHPVEL